MSKVSNWFFSEFKWSLNNCSKFAVTLLSTVMLLCLPIHASAIEISGEQYNGSISGNGLVDDDLYELKSPQGINNRTEVNLGKSGIENLGQKLVSDSPAEKIGVSRAINALDDNVKFQNSIKWAKPAVGGNVSLLVFTSPGAAGLRVAMQVAAKIPNNAEFRFLSYKADGSHIVEEMVIGERINQLVAVNKASGETGSGVSMYWSPSIAGDKAGIEIYLPEGVDAGKLNVAFPMLSHLVTYWDQLHQKDVTGGTSQMSNACQNDATCYAGWLNQRNAVARMLFSTPEGTFTCTGSLLNDTVSGTFVPYFATANHCIGSQSVASSLQTRWFEESSSCNGNSRNPNFTTRSGGAQLLYTKPASNGSGSNLNQDFTFLRLNDTPPSGVYFLGWNSTIGAGTLTGIHHPASDWKKLSHGSNEGSYNCYSTGGNGFACGGTASGNFQRINWTDGGTEGGSSGSAFFANSDQFLGTLYGGGGGSCAGSVSFYSKFGAAFAAGNLGQWLTPPITSPDLIAQSIAVDDNTLSPGEAFFTFAATRNQGTGASTSTTLRYYVSTNSLISTSDTQMSTDAVSALGAGTNQNHSDVNAAPATDGNYWVGACVDSVNGEVDTTNNCSTGVAIYVSSIVGGPDTYEADNSSGAAKPIQKSVMQLHNFHVAGDQDWMSFTVLEAVDNLRVETSYAGFGGDTVLYLYNDLLQQVATNDDDGVGLFSRIEVSSLPAGNYFIRAIEFGNDGVMQGYNVEMQFTQGDILDFLPAILSATQ